MTIHFLIGLLLLLLLTSVVILVRRTTIVLPGNIIIREFVLVQLGPEQVQRLGAIIVVLVKKHH